MDWVLSPSCTTNIGHITSHHGISYNITSPHITSCHTISHMDWVLSPSYTTNTGHITSYHTISNHSTSQNMTSIASYHTIVAPLNSTLQSYVSSTLTPLQFRCTVLFFYLLVIPGRRTPLARIRSPWPPPPDTTYRGKKNTART